MPVEPENKRAENFKDSLTVIVSLSYVGKVEVRRDHWDLLCHAYFAPRLDFLESRLWRLGVQDNTVRMLRD